MVVGSPLAARLYVKKKKKVRGTSYKARSRGRASPDTLVFFEPAKHADDRADYCLDCSGLPRCKHQVHVFTLEWNGARPMGEQW